MALCYAYPPSPPPERWPKEGYASTSLASSSSSGGRSSSIVSACNRPALLTSRRHDHSFSPPSVLRPVAHSPPLSSHEDDGADSTTPPPQMQPLDMGTAPPSPQPQTVSALAAFASEMFTWLWFAPPEKGGKRGVSKQQVAPSPRFVKFCHDVITTTQVSHAVVLLALLFVSRLKERNVIAGALGSEFRLACVSLMVANKILDDNTYTARTWSEVSCLELKPLVAGEAEFLKGLDFQLSVTQREFALWTKSLEAHVATRKNQLAMRTVPVAASWAVQPDTYRPSPTLSREHELVGLGFGSEIPFDARRSPPMVAPQHFAQRWITHPSAYKGGPTPPLSSTFASFPPPHIATPPQPSYSPYGTYSFPDSTPLRPAHFSSAAATSSTRQHMHARTSSDCYRAPQPRSRSPLQALTSSSKRGAAEAFGEDAESNKRLTAMSRSFSAGSSPTDAHSRSYQHHASFVNGASPTYPVSTASRLQHEYRHTPPTRYNPAMTYQYPQQ